MSDGVFELDVPEPTHKVAVDLANASLIQDAQGTQGLALQLSGESEQHGHLAVLNLLHLDEAAVIVALILHEVSQTDEATSWRFNQKLKLTLEELRS